MPIERKHRQTIIDHDPNTGQIVGATKIFHRQIVEGDQVYGIDPESENLAVQDVPTIWGETTNAHVAKLQETENILAAEREAWAVKQKEFEDSIKTFSERVTLAEGQCAVLTEKLNNVAAAVR